MADKRISELDKIVTIDHENDELVIVDKDTNVTKKATLDQVDHDKLQNSGTNSHADIDAHIADDDKHREIDDLTPSTESLYSSQKIEDELADKADAVHTHDASDIISGEFSDAQISESSVTQHEGAINHDNLQGYEANEHVDHTSVEIEAGEGLEGGGDISATRTISLAVDSLTAIANAEDGDFLLVYDVSDNTHKKITKADLIAGLTVGGGTQVKVSANDTTSKFLEDALENLDGKLEISVENEGGNETLSISVLEDQIDHDELANFELDEHIKWGSVGPERIDDSRIKASSIVQHEGAINHDSLDGFVLDEHWNHKTIYMETEEGIKGGGDISATRTLSLDLPNLEIEYDPDNNLDYMLIFDASSGKHKKVLLNDIVNVGNDSGESNTIQNVGDGDGDVWRDKLGSTLYLRRQKSVHDRLDIETVGDNVEYDLDLTFQRILRVENNPKKGEYGSIEAAIDAINLAGDNSSTVRYLVELGVGRFFENELTVPAYVTIKGKSENASAVVPNGDHNLFVMETNSALRDLRIEGVHSTRSCIKVEDTTNITIKRVTTVGGGYGLEHKPTVAGPDSVVLIFNMTTLNPAIASIYTSTTGTTAVARTRLFNLVSVTTGAANPSVGHICCEGENSQQLVRSSLFDTIGVLGSTAIKVGPGAIMEIVGSKIQNFDKAVEVPLGSINANVKASSLLFRDNNINLEILEPTASGFFTGFSEYSKTNIVKESPFFVSNKDPNIITVAKKGGDFESVVDALATITDESISNPYIIQVGPGIFYEDPFTLRSNITLAGTVGGLTILRPNNQSTHFITLEASVQIIEMEMYGPTDSGTYTLHCPDTVSGLVLIRDSSFSDTNGILNMEAGAGNVPYVVFETALVNQNVTSLRTVINVEADPASIGQIILSDCQFSLQQPNANFDKFVGAEGPVTIQCRNVVLQNFPFGPAQGTGVEVSDGVKLQFESSSFNNFVYGLRTLNVGSGPNITGSMRIENCTNDISIENPDTDGALFATADDDKVFIDPAAANFAYTSLDSQGKGFIVVSDILQGDRQDRTIRFSKLVRDTATMGLIEGGDISESGALQIEIAAGSGFLRDISEDFIKEIEWDTLNVNLSDDSTLYIYINDSGTAVASESRPSSENILFLGRVRTNDGSIVWIEKTKLRATHWSNDNDEKNREATGAIYVNGSQIQEGASDRQINVGSGVYYFSNDRFSPSGGNTIDMELVFRDGIGGHTFTTLNTIPNDEYDDGSGTPAAIPAGHYAKYSLYVVGDGANERYLLVAPQFTDAALVVVEEGNIPTPPEYFNESVALIASIIIQEGVGPITKTFDLRPITGARAATLSASSDHGELLGLADDDHLQYLNRSGVRPMTGDLNMGGNDITNVSTVDGVDVSNHKDRHLPNGADPLDTAVAVTIGTSNQEGNANSFARSNHVHDHGQQTQGDHHEAVTQVKNGFMSAADKTKLDAIEELAKDDQDAFEVPYNNADSTLVATDVKEGLDELSQRTEDLDVAKLSRDGSQAMTGDLDMDGNNIITGSGTVDGRDVSADGANLDAHLNGGGNKHDATEIDYERLDGSKVDIQASSDDVEAGLSDLDDNKLSRTGSQAMTGSLDMGGNNVTNVGTVDGRDVSVDGAKLDTIETNAKDDQVASEVPYSNVDSTLTSTDVKSGLDELDQKILDEVANLDNAKLDRDGSQAMTGSLDMGGNEITNVGNVDGRDVSADGATLDSTVSTLSAHLDGSGSKHDASEVDYERLDGSKVDIDAASDTTEAAISDLDDQKLSRHGNNAMEANLSMGNNSITNVNLVDGRDVSADGANLDAAIATLNAHLDGSGSKHDATEIDYERADGSKIDIQASSDTAESAITDLDNTKLSRNGNNAMAADLDLGSNNITNVGNVDGRDVSADGATLDALGVTVANHLNGSGNKHDASEIDYERTDVNKTDIDAASDTVELAVSDLDDNKLSRTGSQAMTGSLDMGGNAITNVGNVDGRDISADGTKLDTIETNAKDDQIAVEVPYNNADSTLVATEVKGGLDELDQKIEDLETNLDDSKLSRNGSLPMTGSLNMGGNAITNVGTVDGVDISAHATRHLPNGADPLATAAAVTLGANSTNTEGNANSFARSNHTHDINTGVAVNVSDTNTEGSSNNLARADHTHNIFPVLEHDETSDEGSSTTTSQTYQTKLTLTTASLTAGRKYRISAHMEHRCTNSTGALTDVRLVVNGVEVSREAIEQEDTSGFHNFTPFYYFTPVSNGSIDIVLQYRQIEVGGAQVEVRRARIEIERKA